MRWALEDCLSPRALNNLLLAITARHRQQVSTRIERVGDDRDREGWLFQLRRSADGDGYGS